MKRIKIGDVFAVKLFNGYKLLQWAYAIPRFSDYIRVFDGLYNEIPCDLNTIVNGMHSYIIGYDIRKAYRSGVARLVGRFDVPEEFPYPDLSVDFHMDMSGEIYKIDVESSIGSIGEHTLLHFPVSRMSELPQEYRTLTLIGRRFLPDARMLYLFDVDFKLTDLHKFFVAPPGNEEYVRRILQPYIELINNASI